MREITPISKEISSDLPEFKNKEADFARYLKEIIIGSFYLLLRDLEILENQGTSRQASANWKPN